MKIKEFVSQKNCFFTVEFAHGGVVVTAMVFCGVKIFESILTVNPLKKFFFENSKNIVKKNFFVKNIP
jgi:hypothetical protein